MEAVTYRVGAHSTSDDPSRYRDEAVTQKWAKLDPIDRLANYLRHRGVLKDGDLAAMQAEFDDEVRSTLTEVEQIGPPPMRWLFEDVFAEMPTHLKVQMAQVIAAQNESAADIG